MADARLIIVTHLLAAGAGYSLAPRELLETEVEHTGFFTTDTKRVLSAAVESLRAENKLLVLSYRGHAAVSVERDGFLFLNGSQDLIVPASVGYYVDLSGLTLRDVSYDGRSGLVTVRLPPLMLGDVAFEPEGARTINGGLLTFSQAEADELTKANYRTARRAFVKQAQDKELTSAAYRNAERAITAYLLSALTLTNHSNVTVKIVY